MRFAPTLTLLVTTAGMAACASGGAGTAAARTPITQSVGVGSDRLTISPGGGPNINTLDFSPDKVWRILPAAFDSISVPVNHVDPASKSIGNSGFKIRQRLGKTPLSRFIDCGQTQIGQNADGYDVYIVLMVQAVAEGTGTRLLTTFEASARPLTFSQSYSRCSSKASLEARLLAAIRAQLQ